MDIPLIKPRAEVVASSPLTLGRDPSSRSSSLLKQAMRAHLSILHHALVRALILTAFLVLIRLNRPIPREDPFVVVTGANTGYFRGLKNLVGSLHFWEPERLVIVYDLGLTPSERRDAEGWRNVILRDSPDVADLKQYRWKPKCVMDALALTPKVLWIDAGSEVRGPLTKIEALMTRDRHFFVCGQDADFTKYIAPAALRYFNLTTDVAELKRSVLHSDDVPSFSGNLQGHVRDSLAYRLVTIPWYECAMRPACMSPPGSSLANHRYDQSILSLLIYTQQSVLHVQPHTELLAADLRQLNPDHHEPSEMVIYTARASSTQYLKYITMRDTSLFS